jgi:hypothetical protein
VGGDIKHLNITSFDVAFPAIILHRRLSANSCNCKPVDLFESVTEDQHNMKYAPFSDAQIHAV